MNCNKKSHFDGVTPAHGQEGGREDLDMSVCREEVSRRPEEEEKETREVRERKGDEILRGEGLRGQNRLKRVQGERRERGGREEEKIKIKSEGGSD